ncbi:MAG: glycosyltransferase, partial [Alphaproteobacteria bacterium]
LLARAGALTPDHILCLGAGFGALPIALARIWPEARITATEHHPALIPALEANIAAHGLADRIVARHGIPAPAGGETPPLLIRSRDAPDFHDLVAGNGLEPWMEPLPCPYLALPDSRWDLVLNATPALFDTALAEAERCRAPLASRTAALPRQVMHRLDGLGLAHVVEVPGAGSLASPWIARPAGPRLDVVVPVYGVEDYVVDCVDSLMAEPDPDIRILVVDDASPDRSVEKLRDRFGPDTERFAILSKPNGGCASARNFGRRAGRSEFVAFCDGDDRVEPGLFPRLLEAARLSGREMVQAGFKFLHEDDEGARAVPSYEAADFADITRGREGGMTSFAVEAGVLMTGQPSIWRRIYRRDFLDAHAVAFPEHIRAFDDQFVQLATLGRVGAVLMIDGPCYLYRQHPAQDIAQADARHFHSLETFRAVLRLALAEGWTTTGPLVTAMCHSFNWSAKALPEDLRAAYLRGAGWLMAIAEKALGPGFPRDRLAVLEIDDIRLSWQATGRRLAGLPDGAIWAALDRPEFHAGLIGTNGA